MKRAGVMLAMLDGTKWRRIARRRLAVRGKDEGGRSKRGLLAHLKRVGEHDARLKLQRHSASATNGGEKSARERTLREAEEQPGNRG